MSLADRISWFFLASLAVVLAGFSVALYALAAEHLGRQVDERLDAALATLAAAAEVNPGVVEWEPGERVLGLGRDPGAEGLRWVIRNEHGPVDRSENFDPRRLASADSPGISAGRLLDHDGRPWQVKVRRLEPPDAIGPPSGASAPELTAGHKFPALDLLVFAPLGPTEATLRLLGLTLAGLSVTLWLAATVVGRRLCRRALAPLTRMAEAARMADATESGSRLPVPTTQDELADLGHAFNGLLDRLHEALERQRRFAGDASHQLRTPLAGLLGQVDVVLRRDRTTEEYRRVLSLVRGKAAQLRQIVESLLFLARAASEAGLPELEDVNLTVWLPEHLREWSSHPRADDLRTTVVEEDPLPVRVHPPLLAQLVDNLLENAGKYSQPGTPIVIRLRREAEVVVLDVEDRGVGIVPDELPHVFEPFYRSPDARRRGESGVGLGLAVARRIASAFGGGLDVWSARESAAGSSYDCRQPAPSRADHGPRWLSLERCSIPFGSLCPEKSARFLTAKAKDLGESECDMRSRSIGLETPKNGHPSPADGTP